MSEIILVVDYGSGNLQSVINALQLVKNPGQEVIVSNRPSDLKLATSIVLPGVGSFAACFSGLEIIPQMIEELRIQALINRKPFLGICVGMQLLADVGYEYTESKGLGLIHGQVKKIEVGDSNLKIPHMGWNDLQIKNNNHPVLQGIKSGDHAYFVHSYHFICDDTNNVLATVEYGQKINAMIAKDNIVATQFHPEKSSEVGLRLLKNFLNWKIHQ